MKDPRIEGSATPRRRRGVILIALGVVADGDSVSAASGAVLARGSSAPQAPKPIRRGFSGDPVTGRSPSREGPEPIGEAGPTPTPSAEPARDPTALADGIYPTFVRRSVDVQGGTVSVDVLQVVRRRDRATPGSDRGSGVPGLTCGTTPLYIRNENPSLRTLPVARVTPQIRFIGARARAPNSQVGLDAAAERDDAVPTRPSTTRCRSSMAVSLPSKQKIAISAC